MENYRPINAELYTAKQSTDRSTAPSYRGNERTPIPDRMRSFVNKDDTDIHVADLGFMNLLIERHGRNRETEDGLSHRDAFIQATKTFREYAFGVREAEESTDINADAPDMKDESGARMGLLATLFLNHPEFKGTYLGMHQEKFIKAYPAFLEGLTTNEVSQAESTNQYFLEVEDTLTDAMWTAAESFDDDDIDAIGFVMGLKETRGNYRGPKGRRAEFATIGTGAFISLLTDVVEDADTNQSDIGLSVHHELLARDGLGFQLMRMNLHDFAYSVEAVTEDMTIDEKKAFVDQHDFRPGLCPAVLKMPSAEDPQLERPIVYEYASAIVNHLPKNLAA